MVGISTVLDLEGFELLRRSVEHLDRGFTDLPVFERADDKAALEGVLSSVAERMQDNYPYPHPLYAGQMLKPPHPVARLAYALALWINPNNHALDGGRASSVMEKEAVAEIAAMFGWTEHLGHLCGGGTMANLEALWVAGRINPGQLVVASSQAHYTHSRLAEVLQIPFRVVSCDASARMDLDVLEVLLRSERVGTVIATMGTTAAGSVDPLPGLLALQAEYGFRIHADAAYGGYFALVDDLGADTKAALAVVHRADSIAIDPHKHGLQPYGCGCILFRDPGVGTLYRHDSPYTYFSSTDLHLGEISLECSRPGAAAVALWATQRLLPLTSGGAFAQRLARSPQAARRLAARIAADPRWMLAFDPELDIVVWAPHAARASEASRRSRAIFTTAAAAGLHLAVANFPKSLLQARWPALEWDQDEVFCLRSCLMKPEHLDWVDHIWDRLNEAGDAVSGAEVTADAGHAA